MAWPRRSSAPSDTGWTSEVSSSLALAGFLFLVFLGFTLLAMGPLVSYDAYFNLAQPPPQWVPVLHVMDRIGQRAVCLPILAVTMLVCARYRHSWRPVYVVGASVFSLNLVVLILKVSLGRGEPETANPAFFVGGLAYPSGHTSNIVLVYGLMVFLLARYRRVGPGVRLALWAAVFALSVTMVVTSLTLNWHWFADLIAGLVVGSMMLELTAAVDAALPPDVLCRNPLSELRALRVWLRGATPVAPAAGGPVASGPPLAPVEDARPGQQ